MFVSAPLMLQLYAKLRISRIRSPDAPFILGLCVMLQGEGGLPGQQGVAGPRGEKGSHVG